MTKGTFRTVSAPLQVLCMLSNYCNNFFVSICGVFVVEEVNVDLYFIYFSIVLLLLNYYGYTCTISVELYE